MVRALCQLRMLQHADSTRSSSTVSSTGSQEMVPHVFAAFTFIAKYHEPKEEGLLHSRVEDAAPRDTLESLWVTGADEKDLDPDSRTQPLGEGSCGKLLPSTGQRCFLHP